MNFVAAVLLKHMPKDCVLVVMEALVRRYNFDGVYAAGLERVGLCFYQVRSPALGVLGGLSDNARAFCWPPVVGLCGGLGRWAAARLDVACKPWPGTPLHASLPSCTLRLP
jgi:hypothetical protein